MSGPGKTIKSLKESVALHLVLIALLGLIAYSNTFDVPFQFDDIRNIVENPLVKDFSYFTDTSKAETLRHYIFLGRKTREFTYLTFFANYRLHGLNVTGYHVVNLAVHIFNALLVYLLVVLTFKTPYLLKSTLSKHSGHIALLSALLFVSHPVQTQAVTYIVQRSASLATFFYLASLALYIKWRLIKEQRILHQTQNAHAKKSMVSLSNHSLYALSLLSAVLAMKTKETAFTLPLSVAAYEFIFFEGRTGRRFFYLIPLFLTISIIPLNYMSMISMYKTLEELTGGAVEAARTQDISRLDYLFTEFRVIVTYLRLLVLPVNQNLDYDYPVYHSFFEPQVFLSFLFLLGVFGLGVYCLYRSRVMDRSSETHSSHITDHSSRLVAFGIFWFFITLSVESSIIPLHVIYEHRAYLPSAGAFSAFAVGAFLLMERFKTRETRHIAVLSTVLLLILLSCATYARNTIWQSEATLWEDVLQKSPQKARPHVNLGNAFMSKGETERAIKHFETAAKLEPDLAETYNSLGVAYASKGLIDKAIRHYQIAVRLKPDNAEIHINLGNAFASKGLTEKAIEHYQTALRLKPDNAKAHLELSAVYGLRGLTDKTIEHLRTALRLKADDAELYYNLGVAYGRKGLTDKAGIAYGRKGLTDKAIEHYQTAIRLNPNNADIHYNLGVAYGRKGLTDKAIEHYKTALRLKPDYADTHYNLGVAYESKGLIEKAIRHFQIAVRLKPDNAEIHINLGNAYLAKGLADKAIEHYKTALRLRPDYAGAHYNLGLAYLRKGHTDKARREFETVLKIDPDYHEAQRLLNNISRE
jgi:tetratricopeptide (TPR) repeat protein